MKIIGITGPAGSGKDTAAGFIEAKFGAVGYSFANPIKNMVNIVLRAIGEPCLWHDRAWKERVIPKLGVSPRRMAQTLGTEWGRDLVHPNLWVMVGEGIMAHADRLSEHQGGKLVIVVPDVRFENEATYIRDSGGLMLHIWRPDVAPVEKHSSENGIAFKEGDRQIMNSGTIDDFRVRVLAALEGFL